MPAAFIPEEGQLAALQLIADNADWWVMLFTNEPTIDAGTVLADLTAATFDGYAPEQLTAWNSPATVSGKAKMTHPEVAWMLDSEPGETITGAALFDGGGLLIAVRRFDTDRELANVGDQLKITPTYSFFDVSLA